MLKRAGIYNRIPIWCITMVKQIRPEIDADFQRSAFLEPVEGRKAAGEEQGMYAVIGESSLNAAQRPVSFLGWSMTLVVGALLWTLIFYLV